MYECQQCEENYFTRAESRQYTHSNICNTEMGTCEEYFYLSKEGYCTQAFCNYNQFFQKDSEVCGTCGLNESPIYNDDQNRVGCESNAIEKSKNFIMDVLNQPPDFEQFTQTQSQTAQWILDAWKNTQILGGPLTETLRLDSTQIYNPFRDFMENTAIDMKQKIENTGMNNLTNFFRIRNLEKNE